MAGDRGGELGEGLREQLRRVLQARPDEAVQLVASLKIAGPWSDGQRVSVGHASEIDQVQIVAELEESEGEWIAVADGMPVPNGELPAWPTERAAMAAVDRVLLREGWALAGGPVALCEHCDHGRVGPEGGIGDSCPHCGGTGRAP
jgi:hypothetical protein